VSATSVTASAAPVPTRRAIVEQVMGMPVSVHVRGEGAREKDVETAIEAGLAGLREADELFSTWRSDSTIERLRRGELELAQCPPEVAQVLELCGTARERTAGWFEHLLDDGSGTRRLDPSGLVKGWAIDRAKATIVKALEQQGSGRMDVAVNAGGDVAVHRGTQQSRPWIVGIEDPADQTRVLATVPLAAGGIATSGNAARGAHIVNPFTGERVSRQGSVTVFGPTLMWADVYATAAFAYGDGCARWLSGLPGFQSEGYDAIVVTADGELIRMNS
jgi:thiamine biosynthesis lipoprotein